MIRRLAFAALLLLAVLVGPASALAQPASPPPGSGAGGSNSGAASEVKAKGEVEVNIDSRKGVSGSAKGFAKLAAGALPEDSLLAKIALQIGSLGGSGAAADLAVKRFVAMACTDDLRGWLPRVCGDLPGAALPSLKLALVLDLTALGRARLLPVALRHELRVPTAILEAALGDGSLRLFVERLALDTSLEAKFGAQGLDLGTMEFELGDSHGLGAFLLFEVLGEFPKLDGELDAGRFELVVKGVLARIEFALRGGGLPGIGGKLPAIQGDGLRVDLQAPKVELPRIRLGKVAVPGGFQGFNLSPLRTQLMGRLRLALPKLEAARLSGDFEAMLDAYIEVSSLTIGIIEDRRLELPGAFALAVDALLKGKLDVVIDHLVELMAALQGRLEAQANLELKTRLKGLKLGKLDGFTIALARARLRAELAAELDGKVTLALAGKLDPQLQAELPLGLRIRLAGLQAGKLDAKLEGEVKAAIAGALTAAIEAALQGKLAAELKAQLSPRLRADLDANVDKKFMWPALRKRLKAELPKVVFGKLTVAWGVEGLLLDDLTFGQPKAELDGKLRPQLKADLEVALEKLLAAQLDLRLKAALNGKLDARLKADLEGMLRARFRLDQAALGFGLPGGLRSVAVCGYRMLRARDDGARQAALARCSLNALGIDTLWTEPLMLNFDIGVGDVDFGTGDYSVKGALTAGYNGDWWGVVVDGDFNQFDLVTPSAGVLGADLQYWDGDIQGWLTTDPTARWRFEGRLSLGGRYQEQTTVFDPNFQALLLEDNSNYIIRGLAMPGVRFQTPTLAWGLWLGVGGFVDIFEPFYVVLASSGNSTNDITIGSTEAVQFNGVGRGRLRWVALPQWLSVRLSADASLMYFTTNTQTQTVSVGDGPAAVAATAEFDTYSQLTVSARLNLDLDAARFATVVPNLGFGLDVVDDGNLGTTAATPVFQAGFRAEVF